MRTCRPLQPPPPSWLFKHQMEKHKFEFSFLLLLPRQQISSPSLAHHSNEAAETPHQFSNTGCSLNELVSCRHPDQSLWSLSSWCPLDLLTIDEGTPEYVSKPIPSRFQWLEIVLISVQLNDAIWAHSSQLSLNTFPLCTLINIQIHLNESKQDLKTAGGYGACVQPQLYSSFIMSMIQFAWNSSWNAAKHCQPGSCWWITPLHYSCTNHCLDSTRYWSASVWGWRWGKILACISRLI